MLKGLFPIIILYLAFTFKSSAQDSLYHQNAIQKPSVLSAHVFGVFISRIEADFRSQSHDKWSLQLDYLSANIWGQPVETYIPQTPELIALAKTRPWHTRETIGDRDDENFQNDTENFKIAFDGVIKGLKAKLRIPINTKNSLGIELRSFVLTDGRFPFTGITGDNFIETFHSNVAGGEDPFQRRDFGLNQNRIDYTDRQGRRMLIEDDFIFGGLKFNFQHYFTNFKPLDIHFNSGLHLGLNASKFNQSIDLGVSANAFRSFFLDDRHYFQFGLGLGYLHLNTLSLSKENIGFGTRNYFLNLESAVTYNYVNKKQKTHSFGIDFYIQSAYNNPDEYDYSIIYRNEKAITSWHHAASHLYRNTNYWTFFYSITNKNSFSIYLQQDLIVNNSPDLQTGVSYRIYF